MRARTEGPWIPGKGIRFLWPDPSDPDLQRLRDGVQEEGAHLYLFYVPGPVGGSYRKVLAEAYYPSEMQSATWSMLDPRQHTDWQEGRLVVISTKSLHGTFQVGGGGPGSVFAFMRLTDDMIEEVRRNNRNARADLRRKASSAYLRQEVQNAVEEKEHQEAMGSEFADEYVRAFNDSMKQAKPHVYTS